MKRVFVIGCLLYLIGGAFAQQDNAQFVWADKEGGGRQDYVYFRNEIVLEDIPDTAYLNIFVDSRYHLYVNEVFINFGPVRFYPEHIKYDTYDLKPYLKEGKNVLAVKALSNGMNTYQVPYSKGGFIAWSSFSGNDNLNLSTPGNWIFKRETAYDPTAPKMSFATGVMEVFDAREMVENWNSIDADIGEWQAVKIVKHQDHWGEMTQRDIPHLTQDEYIVKNALGMYHLDETEQIYSFRRRLSDEKRSVVDNNAWFYGYTYLYSSKKQVVDVGLWWGEYWLNGKDVKPDFTRYFNRNVYSETTLQLEEGWNFFLVGYNVFQSLWDFYMAVPKEAGIILSATKEFEPSAFFNIAGPFENDFLEIAGEKQIAYTDEKSLRKKIRKWELIQNEESANNPAWEMAWSKIKDTLELDPSDVYDIEIPARSKVAIVFDLGQKRLGRIFTDYTASEGTIVDIGFTEDLRNGLPSILKRPGLYTATRHISAGGKSRLETFKPYGARYLQMNVYNSSEKSATIHKTGIISQIYPFEKTGSFECSDPMFNAIWELGWRTLEVCSEDSYTDTPYRERGLYAGDALPEFAITLATSGDPRLVKQSLDVFQHMYADLFFPGRLKPEDTPGLLSDFPLITLEYFRWYVDWTGDIEYAKKLYPNYKYMIVNGLKSFDDKGLFENRRAFIEWTQIEKTAQLTAMQAIFARSLKNMSYLAELLGYEDDKKLYDQREKLLRESIQQHCWDEGKGAFHDGFKNGEKIDHHFPISSAWMSLNDYTTDNQEEALELFYRNELKDIGNVSRHKKTTPYGGFYVLGGLYRQGYADIAEDFIRKYWTPMILKHNDTAWENFDDGSEWGSGQGTLSHAWSGGPTYYMTTEILGVKLGFPYIYSPDTVYIEPQSESITWAKGTVPHPKGVISVEWKITGNKLIIDYSGPDDITYMIKPKGKLAEYELIFNQ